LKSGRTNTCEPLIINNDGKHCTCLIISLARESIYYPVWRDFFAGKYVLCYTNEIFAEYGEILARKMGEEIAANDFPKVDVIGIEKF